MELHLKTIGIILIVLAFIHMVFPGFFKWKQELQALSLVNRQLMLVHTFFIALMMLLVGLLCLSSAPELINTHLGKRISLGLGVFWSLRLFIQFFGYSPALWRGKPFETTVHVLFILLWTYLSLIFLMIYFN